MKYTSYFGKREESSVGVITPAVGREELPAIIKDKFGERVNKVWKLFEHTNPMVEGWLIITNTRIICYIVQDMNHFTESSRFPWVIHDTKNLKITRIDDEEIRINDKPVYVDPVFCSSERLKDEVSGYLTGLSKPTSDLQKHFWHIQNDDYVGKKQKKPSPNIDFFICASHLDYAIAKAIKDILESNSIRAFVAHKDIPKGRKNWHSDVKENIMKSKKVLVLATRNLQEESTYCHYEVGFAEGYGTPIDVFAFGPTKNFDEYIRLTQSYPFDKNNQKVKEALDDLTGKTLSAKEEHLTRLNQAIVHYFTHDAAEQSNSTNPEIMAEIKSFVIDMGRDYKDWPSPGWSKVDKKYETWKRDDIISDYFASGNIISKIRHMKSMYSGALLKKENMERFRKLCKNIGINYDEL